MIFGAGANGMQYKFGPVFKTGGMFSFSLLRRGDRCWAGSPSPNTWMGGGAGRVVTCLSLMHSWFFLKCPRRCWVCGRCDWGWSSHPQN